MRKTSLYILGILIILACNNCQNHKQETNMEQEAVPLSLTTELQTKKEGFEKSAPEEKKLLYNKGIDAVKNSAILDLAIHVNEVAPNFSLKNAAGESVVLYEALKKGPVILIWYRGGWCPYCNLTLKYMQDFLPEFKKEGAQLMALTPELPDSSLNTKEKNNLHFTVLSDIGNKVAKSYGVVFKLIPSVAQKYEEGFGLHAYNGDASDELPLAATYIIDTDKIVRYAFLDADYRNRAAPEEILLALKKL